MRRYALRSQLGEVSSGDRQVEETECRGDAGSGTTCHFDWEEVQRLRTTQPPQTCSRTWSTNPIPIRVAESDGAECILEIDQGYSKLSIICRPLDRDSLLIGNHAERHQGSFCQSYCWWTWLCLGWSFLAQKAVKIRHLLDGYSTSTKQPKFVLRMSGDGPAV